VPTRLVLVRHGNPAANYLEHLDPGLDDSGRVQAAAMAAVLQESGPLPIVSSPKARALETAAALEQVWGRAATIEPRVAEIPAPTDELTDRSAWLRELLGASWADIREPRLHEWRVGVRAALLALSTDTVIVTHYMVINAAVGLATGDDRLVVFRPDHCSRTVLDVAGEQLNLIELGQERRTTIA
jgi:broad specificity phosphatase PhoE